MKALKLVKGAAIRRSTTERKVDLIARLFTIILMTFALSLTGSAAGTTNFVPFADQSTVALWLFDDQPYPHAIITDASQNEYDLILMDGTLEAGKFGNALAASSSGNYKVSYAGWQGAVNELSPLREASGKRSLWGPTIQPQKILTTLVSTKWTLEFWLKLNSVPTATAYILDLGHAYLPGLTITLHNDERAFRFQFNNDYAGLHSTCLTHSNIADFQWHHIAFIRVGEIITHFVDGVLQTQCDNESVVSQPLPEFWEPTNWGTDAHGFTKDSPDEWRRQNRFNISLGEGRDGDGDLDGLLDEMRFSNTVRYSNNNNDNNNWFPVPGSFARNYSENAPRPAVRTGPPLLFGVSAPTNDSVQLGGRKYVFIDDALLDTKDDNVALTLNSLNLAELRKDLTLVISATDMIPFQPGHGDWRETVYDHDGKVYLFINDSYTSQYGISRLYVSKDGLNFTVPNLSRITGLPENYVFYKRPMGATIIKDQNPNISPEERFKITAYGPNRGIYLYVSPDGIRWRRNELAMLPLIHGGDPETFWDDQQGEYVTHLKRDSSYHTDDCPGNGRRGVRFSSTDPFRPWPMRKEVDNIPFLPYFEYYPMPAVTCQGLVTFPIRISDAGREDVYRTRAMKYPWAPDTYVALIWRGIINDSSPDHQRRQVELGVSRNGKDWSVYDYETYGYYMPSIGTIGTTDTREVQSFFGLIRRDDKLWHYAEYNTKNNGGGSRRYSRLEQRLDGFVSLDAGSVVGYAITRPLVFTGKFLELNTKANNGSVRVGILDGQENEIQGFGINDCIPLTQDSVRARVQWKNGSNVESLAGRVVRLKFELQNAKLYALQFFRTGCDANYDGKVDRTDINMLMDARGTPIASDDPRDVDGDGRITVGDSRICALRCDNPQCAP